MPGIQTFTTDDSLAVLRDEWLYTMVRLQKSVHTAVFVADFQPIGAQIDAAIASEQGLDDAAIGAVAGRDAADDDLDPLVVQLSHALLALTKNDRTDPQFVSYFGNQTPAEITRPVLGPELATVSDWVAPLKAETDPGVHALADPIDKAVTAGTAAETAVKTTTKALSDFRLTGDRKKVTDAFNAARGNLHGLLVKFQHDHPDLRLTSAWPAGFFKHTARTEKYGKTSSEAQGHVARLTADLAAAQAHLADLKTKEDAAAKAKKQREDARAQLATQRANVKAEKAKQKALEAEATKKLK